MSGSRCSVVCFMRCLLKVRQSSVSVRILWLLNRLGALKASLAFQEYRIANVITNLRIKDASAELRKLTVDEKQSIYDQLVSPSSEDITWSDLCDFLGFKRSQLKGVGSLTEDGEERISSRPPRLTSVQRIYESDNKIRKPLVAWWKSASDNEHEAMIRLLSNTVDIDKVREDVAYASAIEFIDGLDDDALTKLDSVDLPSGRAAYSVELCKTHSSDADY